MLHSPDPIQAQFIDARRNQILDAAAKLLLKNRALTIRLLLNIILLAGIAVVVRTIGLLLFILPGLCVLVICSLALWYLFAQYSISAEMPAVGLALAKSSQLAL